MPAEAHVTSIWKTQRIFAAVFFIGFAGFFFWDGEVGYPRSNERWLTHEQFSKTDKAADWPAYAASRGWTDQVPEKFHKPEDIFMQYLCGGLSGALGLIVLAYWAMQRGRVLKSDEEGVVAPSGLRVPFESITGLGKKNWDRKGIAKVRFEMGGKKGEFVLDDYKFEQEPTHKILAEIEEKLLSPSAEIQHE
jgi:hypothetical protein